MRVKWRLALAVVTLLLVGAAGGCRAEGESDSRDFYAEVRVEVAADADGSLGRVRRGPESSLLRWWQASDPQRWRWEIETRDSDIDDGTRMFLSDGTSMWSYDDRSMTYMEEPAPQLPEGMVMSPSLGAPVGPTAAEDLDAFIERWSGDGAEVRLVGEGTALDRPVQLIEIRPAWRSSEASASGSDQNVESAGGVIRVAIDAERMFVMRWEVDGEGGGESYLAEVVAFDDEPALDDSLFEFDPPEGASKVGDLAGSCSGSSGTMGGSQVSFPPGFAVPEYIPAGFSSTGAGSEGGAGCGIDVAWAVLDGDQGGYILIRQRARRALPESVLGWEPVALDRGEAYRSSLGGIERLAWHQRDAAILLESDTLPLEELVRVANSFR